MRTCVRSPRATPARPSRSKGAWASPAAATLTFSASGVPSARMLPSLERDLALVEALQRQIGA